MCFDCDEKRVTIVIAVIFWYKYVNGLKSFNFKEILKI